MSTCKLGLGHDWTFHNCARRFHARVGGHDKFTKWIEYKPIATLTADRVVTFRLRHLALLWLPQHFYHRFGIQFPLARVLGFL
jgi:hypothetical protein